MPITLFARTASLCVILLFAAACSTSGTVLTVNPAGNYTANVNPYGGTGR